MKKKTALKSFGGTKQLANALGLTPGAISQWKDELPMDKADRVRGAALRMGLYDRLEANELRELFL